VANSSDKVVSLMSEISAASHEQSQGIEQINSAIAEINMSTQQNAGNAETLASTMSIFKVEIQEYQNIDKDESSDESTSALRRRLLLSDK
jgi:methyl-accepting chemotaxis protein